ncbi:MAG: hypothetical protein H6741_17200 [Alphaproteobacteria bacterium]|nr:hypothetical protein [Alphaproteobacteria bacterium]MCB9794454.1 hypothetical protein [Alphaproteobacteria bacterium]
MPQQYRAFRGQVYAVGFKPDGDTLAFRPNDPVAVSALPDSEGVPGQVAFDENKDGACEVRFQGIDALETHYQPLYSYPKPPGAPTPSAPKPSAGNHHQPQGLGRGATHAMLGQLGIEVSDADWHPWGYLRRVRVNGQVIEDKFQEGVEAVVVADACDRNGRVLGWVFPASVQIQEGDRFDDEALADLLKESVNAHLLTQGWAYAYYYFTLSNTLRNRLSIFARSSIRWDKGVQSPDTSELALTVSTVTELNETTVLWPYLFRKLLRTWRMVALETWYAGGDLSEAALDLLPTARLFETGDPYVYITSTKNFVRLSDVIQIDGDTISMSHWPHEIVFLS